MIPKHTTLGAMLQVAFLSFLEQLYTLENGSCSGHLVKPAPCQMNNYHKCSDLQNDPKVLNLLYCTLLYPIHIHKKWIQCKYFAFRNHLNRKGKVH